MNKFIVSLIETMSIKEIKNILISLDKSERDGYCIYIQKIRNDLSSFCDSFKSV